MADMWRVRIAVGSADSSTTVDDGPETAPEGPWCPTCREWLADVNPGLIEGLRACENGHRWGVRDDEGDGHEHGR